MKPATRFAWLALLALFAALCLGGCGAAGSHDPGPLLAAPRLASIRSSLGGTVHSSLASPLAAAPRLAAKAALIDSARTWNRGQKWDLR